ncbi:MAG: 3-hydroxyacyl-CoA dehydrogenase family protein [Eubacteriales bacterium]
MKIEDVKKVALFGGGTMGTGLAQVFASAGYKVTMFTIGQKDIERAMSIIESNIKTFIERGLIAEDRLEAILANITPTESIEETAADADFVIECIIEDRDAKRELYKKIDDLCPESTVITSNTSYLNIFELMPERRLEKTVIAHWFAPPHIVPLVEVVRGEKTSDETVDFVSALLKKVDHVPAVLEKFIDGFCINRLQRIIGREIFFQIDNGYITPEMLDIAVKASIIPRAMVLGFVQRYDFTGLDLSARNLQNPDYPEPPIDNEPKSLIEHVKKGELGVRSGKGFFDYSDRPIEEVLRERDMKLLDTYESLKDLIYKKI